MMFLDAVPGKIKYIIKKIGKKANRKVKLEKTNLDCFLTYIH